MGGGRKRLGSAAGAIRTRTSLKWRQLRRPSECAVARDGSFGVNRMRHTSPTKPARANAMGVDHAVVAMRGVSSMTCSTLRRGHRLGGRSARTAVGARFEHGQTAVFKRRLPVVRAASACGAAQFEWPNILGWFRVSNLQSAEDCGVIDIGCTSKTSTRAHKTSAALRRARDPDSLQHPESGRDGPGLRLFSPVSGGRRMALVCGSFP